jgi:hypothetical protein
VHIPRSDQQENGDEESDLYVVFVRRNRYDAVLDVGQRHLASPNELDDAEAALDDALNEAGIVITDLEGMFNVDGLDVEEEANDRRYMHVIIFVVGHHGVCHIGRLCLYRCIDGTGYMFHVTYHPAIAWHQPYPH